MKEQYEMLQNKLQKIELELKLERLKSNLFWNIISTHTELKIDDIYKVEEDGVHIHNYENGEIPIFVHDYLCEPKKIIISSKKKKAICSLKFLPASKAMDPNITNVAASRILSMFKIAVFVIILTAVWGSRNAIPGIKNNIS